MCLLSSLQMPGLAPAFGRIWHLASARTRTPVAGLHRASPSATLDKSCTFEHRQGVDALVLSCNASAIIEAAPEDVNSDSLHCLSQALWGTKPVRGVSASSARDDPVHQAG